MKCKTCREHGSFHVPRKQFTSHANFWQCAWKFPCTLQRNICLGKVHGNGNFHVPRNETIMARYMEISMYLAMKHMSRYMEISMYLAMKHMARYMEISLYFALCFIARYMEISMYLATKQLWLGTWKFPCTLQRNIWQGTWKFPCTLQYVSLQGTWKFPCTLQTKHMTKHTLPYVSLQGTLSVVLRKSILAAQRDRNFRRPALMYKRTSKRFIEHISQ